MRVPRSQDGRWPRGFSGALWRRFVAGCAALAFCAAPGWSADALDIASALAELGPRPAGSGAHGRAIELLLATMREIGLEEVAAVEASASGSGVPGGGAASNLIGVLRGRGAHEIVLSAHYDSVARGPGAGDDASGCGVVLAAVADLARTPLEHSVRVVLFDREEDRLAGSRGWVAALTEAERARILAGINVEMVGWSGSGGAVAHLFSVERRGRRVVPPAWLMHAVVDSGRAIGWPVSAADPRVSLLGQLAVRTTELRHYADSDALLAAGIPAILLSDSSLTSFDPAYHSARDTADRLDRARLARWTDLVGATVRRLDGLEGRPRDDDRYLVVFGRVLHRRSLYWLGFVLWVALVVRGLPGRWRRRDAGSRRAAGRLYLPGYVSRMLFLLSLLVAPVLTVALAVPAAVVSLVRWRGRSRWLASGLIALPTAAYLATLAAASARGFVHSIDLELPPALLVIACLVAFVWVLWRPEGPLPGADAAPAVER